MLLSIFGAGLFVSVFLLIFQPFGSGTHIEEGRIWILWGYGMVTILALLFDMLLLPIIFPGIFNESKWNVCKGMLFQFWHILSIGTANILYAGFLGGMKFSFSTIAGFFFITLAVGFFPIIIGIFSIHHYLMNKYVESIKNLNQRIASSDKQGKAEDDQPPAIVITSESEKEKIEIDTNSLLFIKSIENYVECYRKDGETVKTAILRSSLKRIEENLKAYPFLFRCHRTYVVNVKNIARVTGNSQGYKLVYDGVESSIPVSRGNSKKLLGFFA